MVVVARRIDQRAALARAGDEPGLAQPIEVERQRVRREAERARDRAGRHALVAGPHQQTEHVEAVVLGKRGQSRQGV